MDKRNAQQSITLAEDDIIPYLPERALLGAMLERAYRDALSTTIDQNLIREAITWFLGDQELYEFSFEFVAEELRLTGNQVNFIIEKVRSADARNQSSKAGGSQQDGQKKQAQGQNWREGMVEISPGQWSYICEALSSVQRQRRPGRYYCR